MNAFNNEWNSGSSYDFSYQESFKYDHNGNILRLKRNGDANVNVDMDNFIYHYYYFDASTNSYGTYNPQSNAFVPDQPTNRLAYIEEATMIGRTSATMS